MTPSGSPMTSEMIRQIRVPARHARASPPPLICDNCLRTQLSSSIPAPARDNCRVTCCLSFREISGTGAGNSALPPPESYTTQTLSLSSAPTRSRIRRVPKTPRSVGSFSPGGRAPWSSIFSGMSAKNRGLRGSGNSYPPRSGSGRTVLSTTPISLSTDMSQTTQKIYRKRLMKISWFIGNINEHIAREANREDKIKSECQH